MPSWPFFESRFEKTTTNNAHFKGNIIADLSSKCRTNYRFNEKYVFVFVNCSQAEKSLSVWMIVIWICSVPADNKSLQIYAFDIRCASEFVLKIQNRMPNTEGDIAHKNYYSLKKKKYKIIIIKWKLVKFERRIEFISVC